MEEDRIIERREAQAERAPFEDDFGALYRLPGEVPAYDAGAAPPRWVRPQDLSEACEYFHRDASDVGVACGRLDDAWLLGAMAAVASHPDGLVDILFASNADDFTRHGVYTCRFYRDGDWEEVVCDTRLPAEEAAGGFACAYGRSSHRDEFWVPFLEKAYAKLCGSYEALHGGCPAEALVALTGGSCARIDVAVAARRGLVASGALRDLLVAHVGDGGILCLQAADGAGDLLAGRVYSVAEARTLEGVGTLLLVRSPWGPGGDWKGRAPADERLPAEDRPGLFWMPLDALLGAFPTLFLCRLFGDDAFSYSACGEWEGPSAGGPPAPAAAEQAQLPLDLAYPRPRRPRGSPGGGGAYAALLSARLGRHRAAVLREGAEASWFRNPQFVLRAAADCRVHISLRRRCESGGGGGGAAGPPHGLHVLRAAPGEQRAWGAHSPVADSAQEPLAPASPSGEASCDVRLRGGEAYVVVPHAGARGLEGAFCLRFHSRTALDVRPAPPLHCAAASGAWERHSAGGPPLLADDRRPGALKASARWCQNPHFWLRVAAPAAGAAPRSAPVAIVLRRGAGGAADGAECGIVARRAKGTAGGGSGDGDARQRRRRAQRPLGADGGEERPAAAMTIGADEWCRMSGFDGSGEAAMAVADADGAARNGGLVVTPCLSSRGAQGGFVLEAYCALPVSLEALARGAERSLAGEWAEQSAGGSHLCRDTWRRNPKFYLQIRGPAPAAVAISLRRPEAPWRRCCAKDPVGTMIGFYVFRGARPTREAAAAHQGKPWSESAFVTTHRVATPERFFLDPLPADDFYTIMPATYDAGHTGPFLLTVETDAAFALRSAEDARGGWT